jgi:hypothetical protein
MHRTSQTRQNRGICQPVRQYSLRWLINILCLGAAKAAWQSAVLEISCIVLYNEITKKRSAPPREQKEASQ